MAKRGIISCREIVPVVGLLIGIGLIALSVAAEERDTPPVQTPTQNLLNACVEPRQVPLEELKRLYLAAAEQQPESVPYLEFAYAIVLLKNSQPKLAEEHLQKAADSRSPVVLLAHEELIRGELDSGQSAAALDRLAEYATLIGEIPAQGREAAEARRAAEWLGCVMAYLEGPAEVGGDLKILAKTTGEELKLLLDQRYLPDYLAGRLAVEEIRSELHQQLDIALSQVASKRLNDQEEMQTRKGQIEQRAEELKEVSSTAQKTFREQLKDLDGKIKLLESQFALSLESEKRLLAAQILLQAEINRLKQLLQQNDAAAPRGTNLGQAGNAARLRESLAAAEAQYALSINQQALLMQGRYELTGNAQALVQSRQDLANRAGLSQLQTKSELELMQRWETRLAAKQKKQDKDADAGSPLVVRLQKKMRDLTTYDHSTPEQQRQILTRLLFTENPDAGP